jgi:hypothetical protein
MLTFSVILEHAVTHKLAFLTIEECIDMDDCINHIHRENPGFNIEQIRQVES